MTQRARAARVAATCYALVLVFALLHPLMGGFNAAAERVADAAWDSPLEPTMNGIGHSAAPGSSLILLGMLLFAAALIDARASLLALVAFLGMTIFEFALKLVIEGYPSGHVARTAFLAGMVMLLLPRRGAWAAGAAGALVLFAVGVQRIALGYHVGIDVAGGLLTGAGAIAALHAISPAGAQHRLPERPKVGPRPRSSNVPTIPHERLEP
ncbi:MAG: phosphatase PAP2 family protein [Hyphomicrobiales bacterium]